VPRIKRDDGKVKMILPPFAGELNALGRLSLTPLIKAGDISQLMALTCSFLPFCCSSVVKMILPPFAGELNGFTLLFEAFIIKFCKHMPVHLTKVSTK
jgi:hypothetical protein